MTPEAAPSDPAGDLANQAVPLTPKADLNLAVGDIPLPPAVLADALDNTGAAGKPDETDAGETVTLDFVGDELPYAEFPLRFPFRWQGQRIDKVTVRQLTTAQLGTIVTQATRAASFDQMEVYAVMIGLPAKVIRAMPATDSDPIIDKAFDFLPPSLRPASG